MQRLWPSSSLNKSYLFYLACFFGQVFVSTAYASEVPEDSSSKLHEDAVFHLACKEPKIFIDDFSKEADLELYRIQTQKPLTEFKSSITVLTEEDIAHWTVIPERIVHTGTDACVQKITDGTRVCIIKQITDPALAEQFLLINDVVASAMGRRLGIRVNQVSFVPYHVAPHLKLYPERAATMHTYIPGKDLEAELPVSLSSCFTLQQRVINPDSVWQQKVPLAVHQQGLTQAIIESMSLDSGLSCLCALDTFTGNADRSLPNVFYDNKTEHFYGIDQAAAFARTLPSLARDRIKELKDAGYFKECERKVIDSIRLYRYTLQVLHGDNNQPEIVIHSMQSLICHLAPHAKDDSAIQARLKHHKKIIEDNYQATAELIALLDY